MFGEEEFFLGPARYRTKICRLHSPQSGHSKDCAVVVTNGRWTACKNVFLVGPMGDCDLLALSSNITRILTIGAVPADGGTSKT
jgi:hypothetical protein